MAKKLTFHNVWLKSWCMIINSFCLKKTIWGLGSDVMQIIKGKQAVGFYFLTTHHHNKMLNIKLGTVVHLKTCFVWLISLCWLSGHRRSTFLWKCCRCAVFPLPRRSSTPHRLSVLRKAGFLPFSWRRWGSESWRTRRSTPFFRSRSVSTFFRWYGHPVVELAHLTLTNAVLVVERRWKFPHIESLLPAFVKWR